VPLGQILHEFLQWTEQAGTIGALALGTGYIVAALLLFPGAILTMGAGFLYGLLWGTVIVSISSTIAACLAFLIARSFGRSRVADKIAGNEKFSAVDRAVAEQGFKVVFLIRLSPLFPYGLQNYAFGLTDIRLPSYALASWTGMIPGTILYVYFGWAAKGIAEIIAGEAAMSTPQKIFFFSGLAVTVAVVVMITRIAKKAIRNAVSEDANITHGELTNNEDC